MKLINRIVGALGLFLALQAPVLAACGAMGGGQGCSGGRASILLLTLAVGYGVLVLSQSQQRPLNVLGRIIGGVILVVSIIGLGCVAFCGMKKQCGTKASCPWTGSAPTEPAPVPMSPAVNQ